MLVYCTNRLKLFLTSLYMTAEVVTLKVREERLDNSQKKLVRVLLHLLHCCIFCFAYLMLVLTWLSHQGAISPLNVLLQATIWTFWLHDIKQKCCSQSLVLFSSVLQFYHTAFALVDFYFVVWFCLCMWLLCMPSAPCFQCSESGKW